MALRTPRGIDSSPPDWVAAIDIGGSFTKVGLVDQTGRLKAFRRFPTEPPAERFLAALFEQVRELLKTRSRVSGMGVSVAGFIDPAHSMMTYNPNLPWLQQIPLKARLEERFGLPVTVEIDSNAAALAEYRFGNGVGSRRFLCLTIGTGIGGAFMIDGELARFTHECIGDVGHVVVAADGPPCSCGSRGCAEGLVGRPDFGHWLGLLCASLGAIFFPDVIVLGGGVCAGSPGIVAEARETFAARAGRAVLQSAAVLPAKLGASAPLIGARPISR